MSDVTEHMSVEAFLDTQRSNNSKDLIHEFKRYLMICDPDNTLPEPVYDEVKPIPKRKFRLDCAWEDVKLGVELDGGVFSGGRHTRGQGFTNDCIKVNLAQDNGWLVYRYTAGMMRDAPQSMVDQIKRAYERRKGK